MKMQEEPLLITRAVRTATLDVIYFGSKTPSCICMPTLTQGSAITCPIHKYIVELKVSLSFNIICIFYLQGHTSWNTPSPPVGVNKTFGAADCQIAR